MSNVSDSETGIETMELYEIPPVLIFTLTVFYFLVSFTAIVGNSMILWIVYRSKRMKGATNYFIANLAASDLLIGAFSIPFQFQAALLQKWVLPDFMCSFCPTNQVISLNVSIFTLVVLSGDRYRAVMYPLKPKLSKFRVKCLIAIIWCFSIILAIPTTIAYRVEYLFEDNNKTATKAFCTVVGINENLWRTYSYTLVTLQYCFPLSAILYAYIRMGITLFARDLPGEDSAVGNEGQSVRRKRKVIKMLLIVIALFALCWLPFQSYNVVSEIFPKLNTYKYINIIWFGCHWLAMSNSCYNPLIYYLYSENFNYEFRRRFGFLCGNFCKQTPLQRQATTSMDINTLQRYSVYNESRNSSKLARKCRKINDSTQTKHKNSFSHSTFAITHSSDQHLSESVTPNHCLQENVGKHNNDLSIE